MKTEKEMSFNRPIVYSVLFLLLAIAFTIGIHQALANNTLGADFFVFWRAGRAFFIEHTNPYREELTQEIQMSVLGHLAAPGEDQLQFSYPPYVLVMVLPNIFMSYDWAQAAWMAFNLAAILTIAFLLFPRTPPWILASLPLLYNIIYGAGVGNFSLIISLVLFIFFGYFMFHQQPSTGIQIAAGFLLAWSTSKPQSVWLYVIFALLYSYRRQLWPLLRTFAASLVGLLALSFLFQPDWLSEWLSNLVIYAGFTGQNRGILALLGLFHRGMFTSSVTNTAFLIAALILLPLAIYLLAQWWRDRLSDDRMLAGTALITYLLLPNNTSADQMFLLLPIFLWILSRSQAEPAARWWWAGFLIYSYLVLFVDLLQMVPHAITSGMLVFFLAWIVWLLLRQKRQKTSIISTSWISKN